MKGGEGWDTERKGVTGSGVFFGPHPCLWGVSFHLHVINQGGCDSQLVPLQCRWLGFPGLCTPGASGAEPCPAAHGQL